MFRTLFMALASAVLAMSLCGCHHPLQRFFHSKVCNKPQMYNSAQSVPPLQVPAGIDAPDTHAALHIPPLNEPAPPARKPTDPCLDEPPLFAAPRPATHAVPSIS
jgi:uncharacterized lipoprotein